MKFADLIHMMYKLRSLWTLDTCSLVLLALKVSIFEAIISGLNTAIETFKDSFELLRFSALLWDQEMPNYDLASWEKIVFEKNYPDTKLDGICHYYF